MLSQNPTPTVGEIIRNQFMTPLNLNTDAVAVASGMSKEETKAILYGNKKITKDISEKLSDFFCVEPDYFSRLQYILDNRCGANARIAS